MPYLEIVRTGRRWNLMHSWPWYRSERVVGFPFRELNPLQAYFFR